MKYIASFSGGKDSTAMVLRLIDEDWPLDDIVFFDTGWEFPQMYDHIIKFEAFTGRKVTVLHPRESFDYKMAEKPIHRRKKTDPMHGKIYRYGNGWPSFFCRWCTREKITVLNSYLKQAKCYVGIASDESHRLKQREYPLVHWNMTEADCLTYCYQRGFDWGGLYQHFDRVSCFCCPLKRIGDFRKIRTYYPDLWQRMIDMHHSIKSTEGCRFKNKKTVLDLEDRFAAEDRQPCIREAVR
jgi:3'-phosphoadenosine 5'-phosphosulfate sulfotransferase (PAPS reductase)/FAD synthetase